MRGEQEKLRTEAPYSPLSPLEVEALGMPPPSQPDAYLRARIDRFYAELQALSTHLHTHDQLCTHCAGSLPLLVSPECTWLVAGQHLFVAGQDYRPGTSRADVEAEHRRQRRHAGQRWEPMTDQATGQNADGSFSRAGTPSSVPPCRISLPIHALCIPSHSRAQGTYNNTEVRRVGDIA